MNATLGLIKITLMLLLVACSMLGAFGSTFKGRLGFDVHVFLYKITAEGQTTYYANYNVNCMKPIRMFNAAFALAILGWVATLVGTALVVIGVVTPNISEKIPQIVKAVVAVACLVFMTIPWPICVALFHHDYCGLKTGTHYSHGFAFLVITWILAMVWAAFEVMSMLMFAVVIPSNCSDADATKTTEPTWTPDV